MEVREHREELLRRIPTLRILFLTALLGVASAYWFVQVVRGDYYRELAENNRLRRIPVKPPRGLILDREGRLLADNAPSYNLMIDRTRVVNSEASLRFAAGALDQPVDELRRRLASQRGVSEFTPVLLADSLSLSQVARLAAANLEHPEFEIDVGHLRLYRHGGTTAHVLGYLGEVNERELREPESPYRAGDVVGRRGIERTYDGELRGSKGERQVVVDSRGRAREEFGARQARPGSDLRLTLDLELQQIASRYFEDKVGAAVVMDPRTGAILAMVSAPSYNPNQFARRLERAQWQAILEDPGHPLQNRAVQNTFSPGSIFKIVMAVAGLTEHVVTSSDRVYCGGSARFYDRRFRCWKPAGHGWVDLHQAIKESCDVYFYTLGQKLGISRIADYSRQFGLGSVTGIDLGEEEKAGLVPDPEWSQRARGGPWYPGETISVAIGQGPLLVTPLQMAVMVSTIANDGYLVTPHLDAADASRAPPQPAGLDPAALALVREALRAVVNDRGTGASARVEGMEIAGKTGTAQVVEQKTWIDSKDLPYAQRDHAWFVSFGPVNDPELAVVVFVQNGGKGSAVAAPLAQRIYEKYWNDRGNRQPA
jgi:penicillin-binding protein 2